MRLTSKITVIIFIASAFLGFNSGQANATGNGGCRMSKGYESRVEDLQRLLGVHVDGDLGPKTCREVLKIHDVLIESGEIPSAQRGLIGPTTFRVLTNSDERVPASATTPARSETSCRVKHKTTKYVICVDVSAQVGSVRTAQDGVIGDRVIGPFTLTSSRQLTFDGDSITREGQYRITSYARVSTEKKLEFFIPFSGKQGFHYYSKVGSGYDSSGCVRLQYTTAEAIWVLLAESGHIDARIVEAHIYP